MPERYLRTGEAARALGLHRTTLSKWVIKYGLKPTRVTMGGHYEWDLDDLKAQMAELTKRPRAG